ncbi:MAG: HAMP domain-containing histidine kinase [candidate division WOR-3 bacterium]|nr:HAMP domain-containing histidine kinase [candidate division WOR-3 bacterium]
MVPFRVGFRFLQYYFISGIVILAGFWFFYTRYLVRQLEKETAVRSRIYAQYMQRATEPSSESSPELDVIFEEVIKKIDFPVIITDAEGNPISYINLAERNPTPERLKVLMARLDNEHPPIPLTITLNDTIKKLGEIHYGMPSSVKALRLYPFLQLGFLVLFIFIGIWGIVIYHRREQELIWTTLAKETAHQLATPISSLAGWLETLKPSQNQSSVNPEVTTLLNQRPHWSLALSQMEEDVARMREVLERFSRIGLPPELKLRRPKEIIESVILFIKRRTPKSIEFISNIEFNPNIKVDEVLFSWTIENLLKNSVQAIGTNPGQIEITTKPYRNYEFLEIDIIDSGEGIKSALIKDIFKTGATTKKYGWGVGLTLAKRIIEEYHKGKLYLKETKPGRTVFTIQLPIVKTINEKQNVK